MHVVSIPSTGEHPSRALEKLREHAFSMSPQAELLIDVGANNVLLANERACRCLQMERQALEGARASDLFGPALAEWLVFTDEVLERGEAWRHSLFLQAAVNKIYIECFAKKIIADVDACVLLSFQDSEYLTSLRRTVATREQPRPRIEQWAHTSTVFREFERQNHLLLEAAGEGIYGVDSEGRTTFLNPAAERILGWSGAELIGKNAHHYIHHSHRDGCAYPVNRCPIYQAFRDGVVRRVDDDIFWSRSGAPINVEYTSTPIKDRGVLVGAVVVFRDVTQKKRDQQQLLTALKEVQQLKSRLEMENAYLQEELNIEFNHHRIVGKSPAIQQVLQKITMVANTDASVLITGESGTGKELIARAIHDVSERKARPLVRVNCAAIPADLFESEFFGHSKGAFTGATLARVGRFEVADGGTLFLDEVAEIPLALQGKLLRVLQEQQFERVGESKTRSVNVRIIAATNKDLKALVESGEFREDLYFRLNVFPIESVPLRHRRDDIPLLTQHFLQRAARRARRPELKIPLAQVTYLSNYNWPGNIRELENVIERKVILSQGQSLDFSDLVNAETTAVSAPEAPRDSDLMTDAQLKVQERQVILEALKRCRGKVSGAGGAAELLGLRPTTLASRIKKLQIDVRAFKGRNIASAD